MKSEKHSSLYLRWRELVALALRWRELAARAPTTADYLSTILC
ncbi:hypothetical protein [Capnocytophaga granulosa]